MNIEKTLEFIKRNGRLLDYYLIKNLTGDFNEDVKKELLKFQNDDNGFGKGLEPDVQMPVSSVLATNIAISILEDIACDDKDLLAGICEYYISQFDYESREFLFVSQVVDEYPHAVWWNFENRDSFGYFNPTPEVLGFLLKHKYLHNFDVDKEIEYCVNRIANDYLEFKDEHSLYSIIKLYNNVDSLHKELMLPVINESIRGIITLTKEKWLEYSPQPHKLITRKMEIYNEFKEAFEENLEFVKNSITNDGVWYPEWQWYQFDEFFEDKVKYQWMGYITYERIKLINENK